MPANDDPVKLTYATGLRVKNVCARVDGLGGQKGGPQRRPRHMGGGRNGSGSASGRRQARVIGAISAATDNLVEHWGAGTVHLLDPTTGEEIIPVGDDLEVVNPLQMSFGENFWVELEGGRVTDGSCDAWTWAETI